MMDWERPLMAMHAAWICFSDVEPSQRPENIRTLNVGFGMGIVDKEIMSRAPGHHTIIEAHPQVCFGHIRSLLNPVTMVIRTCFLFPYRFTRGWWNRAGLVAMTLPSTWVDGKMLFHV